MWHCGFAKIAGILLILEITDDYDMVFSVDCAKRFCDNCVVYLR